MDCCLLSCDQATSFSSGMTFGIFIGTALSFLFTKYIGFFDGRNGQVIKESYKKKLEEENLTESEESLEDVSNEEKQQEYDSEEEELSLMFSEEEERRSRTKTQILERGKETIQPATFFAKTGGGYMTNEQLESTRKNFDMFVKLTPEEEEDIIRIFRHIEGLPFLKAKGIVEEQGFTLYPMSINDIQLSSSILYKGTTIGVELKCHDMYETPQAQNSIVRKIVNIGGQH